MKSFLLSEKGKISRKKVQWFPEKAKYLGKGSLLIFDFKAKIHLEKLGK